MSDEFAEEASSEEHRTNGRLKATQAFSSQLALRLRLQVAPVCLGFDVVPSSLDTFRFLACASPLSFFGIDVLLPFIRPFDFSEPLELPELKGM